MALFHLFGTLTSGDGEVFIVEVGVEGLVGGKGRRVGSKGKVSIREICCDMEKGEVVGVYRDGTRGECKKDFVGVFYVFE